MQTVGEKLSAFGPRRTDDGGFEFQPLFHDAWWNTRADYVAWWEGLNPVAREVYQKLLDALDEAERSAAEERCQREEKERARGRERDRLEPYQRMQRRGVPAKDHRAIAEGALEDTPALADARALLAGAERVLVLSGPKGCGKTTAAGWLVSQDVPGPPTYGDEYAPRRPQPIFLDVSKLARLSRYKAEDVEPLETCTLLVIDDLGMEYADEKGSFLATLDGVFNARYAAGLFTVITTNLPAKEFKARYGERIADRIREVGRFVELNGNSMRSKATRGGSE